eukprot:gene11141-12140_t
MIKNNDLIHEDDTEEEDSSRSYQTPSLLSHVRRSSTGSNPVSSSADDPKDEKMLEERGFIVITTAFFIFLLSHYWNDYDDQWIIIPGYTLFIAILLLKKDGFSLHRYQYITVAILNTVIIFSLYLLIFSTSPMVREDFDLKNSLRLRLQVLLYTLFSLLVNVRIAKRVNRIKNICDKLQTMKKPGLKNGIIQMNDDAPLDSDFILNELVYKLRDYSGDSLYLFIVSVVTFFCYEIAALREGEIGKFASVMLLLSSELVILAIFDLTVRNIEIDAIEYRYDTSFSKCLPPEKFCGIAVPWFKLLRVVKMQPLSLILLFCGALTIIFFGNQPVAFQPSMQPSSQPTGQPSGQPSAASLL